MTRFVPDIKSYRWVIISPDRANRPKQHGQEKTVSVCPFCTGNENLTPPETYRVEENGLWQVRVVPNKFPITDIHEVVIHSPDHKLDLADLSTSHVQKIIETYQKRYLSLSSFGQVLIFNNKGPKSGESLLHPHSQIVVIPQKIKLDILALETVANIVLETQNFLAYCPDFSQWPYETWITSKGKEIDFGEIPLEEIGELAGVLQTILKKLLLKFPDLSYNFYIAPGKPWYLRIVPRLTQRAGFELGTGLNVNSVDPVKASEELKA